MRHFRHTKSGVQRTIQQDSEDPESLEYVLILDLRLRRLGVKAGGRLLSVDELMMRLDGIGAVLLGIGVEGYVYVLDTAVHVQVGVVMPSVLVMYDVMMGRGIGLLVMARYHGIAGYAGRGCRVATEEVVEAAIREHGGTCVDAGDAGRRFQQVMLVVLRRVRVAGEAAVDTSRCFDDVVGVQRTREMRVRGIRATAGA